MQVNSNRYGVRLGTELPYSARGRGLLPYARVELLYDTRFDTWNRQRYQARIDIAINYRWYVYPCSHIRTTGGTRPPTSMHSA